MGTSEHAPETARRAPRRARIGLLSVGLGAYWEQFPGLLPALEGYADRVAARLEESGGAVVARAFVSGPEEAVVAGERFRAAGLDLLVVHLATYATSTQVLPVIQRAGVPALLIDLQPQPKMDHANTDTGRWLEYCGVCPLPELAATLQRCDIPSRSVSGHLEDTRAWARIAAWVREAGVVAGLRAGRFGLLGHLYPGMLDVATDLTLVHRHTGGHVEVLEMDDLRVRVAGATEAAIDAVLARTRAIFAIADSVKEADLRWAAQVAVGLEALARDFALSALAYYYRGLGGGEYERLGAGLILGASLLTAAGIPCVGEYELRTSLAMQIMDQLGAGGSFTEFQAFNFADGVVEMGHDGPAHLAISADRPILRSLDVYHGKRGEGVAVEFSVREGPVTLLALTQRREGGYRLVVAEGEVVPGPLLELGNTTSRVAFGMDPGEWVDAWCAAGPSHHWAIGIGHQAATLHRVAELLGAEFVQIKPWCITG